MNENEMNRREKKNVDSIQAHAACNTRISRIH